MLKTISLMSVALALAAVAETKGAGEALFLSKSSGFEHSCIKWDDKKISHVDTVLQGLTKDLGVNVLCTKDASLINADNLKKYKLVIFFTTADLTQEGTDKQPPMGPNGEKELLDWIQAGGGFIGYHCASDSFHTPEGGEVTPYLKMLGGEFLTHGAQFDGTLKVIDKTHPTMANIPAEWTVHEEWYRLKNFNADTMHVLAVLDSGAEREKQPDKYNVPNYPVIWCSEYGKGRVYYNAMGHREDVWDNPIFQKGIVDAVHWVLGQGPANAEPNFKTVMTPEDAAKAQTPPPAKPK